MSATPTNDFLTTLKETLTLGHDATLAMLGGAPLDGGILVPTLSAAALLATHADLAKDPQVQDTLFALATDRGRRVLDAALAPSDVEALPELEATMDYEDKVELLREAIELGALTTYAGSDLRAAISAYLDLLEVHVLAYGDAHTDLGPAAELLSNVAPFSADHPVTTLLSMVRAGEYVNDYVLAPANAIELVRQAIAHISTPESLWSKWREGFKRFVQATDRNIAGLIAMPTPTPDLAYAADADGIDEHRFNLTQGQDDEVNVVFQGERVLLEWQGAGEVPVDARLEATTVLDETDNAPTINSDHRVRWILAVPPGDGGTVVTLRFPSGREETLTIPAV